jgi:hypothetical protein
VLVLFAQGLAQYFACSFVSVKVEEDVLVEMPALYKHQRELFLAAGILISFFGIVRVWTGSAVAPTTPARLDDRYSNQRRRHRHTAGRHVRTVPVVQWAAVTAQLAILVGFLVRYWSL